MIIHILNVEYNLKRKFFNALIITLLFINTNIHDIFGNNSFDSKYKSVRKFEGFHFISFIKKMFTNPISHMKKFRDINLKNILLENLDYEKNEFPDVSVIITVYNQENCFQSALRSVQNQSLKNLEIIIIDDCSLDNSSEIIEKYMKEDKRIIFLKHESNEGKIKSRSDGIRLAKGKYITIIDGDDSLANENILYNCFNIAKSGDLDVVQFNFAFFRRKQFKQLYNYLNIKNLNNRIIYQPELSFIFVNYEEKDDIECFANRNIVSKLIKNDLFKKLLEYIGPKYIEDYILEYEDTIMSVSLFQIAKSYYNMNEYGYYIAKEECESSVPLFTKKKCKPKNISINNEIDPIKYLNFLLDIFKGKEIENYLLYRELMSIDHIKSIENITNNNFSYVYSILNRINESNYNYIHRQKRISIIKHKLLKKEFLIKLNNSYHPQKKAIFL